MFPLLLDSTTENLADLVTLSLERLVGTGETDKFLSTVYQVLLLYAHSIVNALLHSISLLQLVVKNSYPILVDRGSTQPYHASHHIPQEIVRYLTL